MEPFSEKALQALDAQREALRREKETAREAAIKASLELSAALGRSARAEKLYEAHEKRVEKFVEKGLSNLDELEAEEESQPAASTIDSSREQIPTDFAGSFSFEDALLSPSYWQPDGTA